MRGIMTVSGVEQSGVQRHIVRDDSADPGQMSFDQLSLEDVSLDPRALDPALVEDAVDPAFPPAAEPGVLHVERVEAMALVGVQTAWADLVTRAIEPNIFLEPAFALPLMQHVAHPKRPGFLLVWEENGDTTFGRLLGLFPLSVPGGPISLDGIVRGFAHKQVGCGVPLVDRERGADAVRALFDWLVAASGRADALLFTELPAEGAFRALLDDVCADDGRACVPIATYRRAALRRRPDVAGRVASFASAKRRKERARQRRRLAEAGRRVYTSARTPAEIAVATERFLALEHNGWKGARGTALLADPSLATFARTMARLTAHEGRCRIDAIELDGRPVAMGIVLSTGRTSFFWKTAFDQRYAALSPGVQLVMELTQTQIEAPDIDITDSCAIADHPMIDRMWPDRITMVDVMIAIEPEARFALSLRLERTRRTLRSFAKRLVHRFRPRRGD